MVKKLNLSAIVDKIKLLKASGKKKYLFAAILILVLILIFATLFFNGKINNSKENTSVLADNYAASLENKLKSMILKIDEINSVDVLVVVNGSAKTNYLVETTEVVTTNSNGSTKTTSTKVVYEKANGTSSPIIVSTSYPEVIGVMIVINKVSASTKLAIKNSVSLVLNIPEESISILQEK